MLRLPDPIRLLPPPVTAAADARRRLGLSPEAAARKLRISPRYLRSVEKHGNAPYPLAERAARLYGVPMQTFLYSVSHQAKGE